MNRLPLTFKHGSANYRLVEVDGELVAHAATCPHWLGPLDQAEVRDGVIACPWHGYRFDLRSGACLNQPKLSLAPAPGIRVRNGRVEAVFG